MPVKPCTTAYTVTDFLEREFEESDDITQHCSRCLMATKFTVSTSKVKTPPIMVSTHIVHRLIFHNRIYI